MVSVETITERLKQAPAPVTLSKLRKELRQDVTAALAQAMEAGTIFAWPRYFNSPRYWHRETAPVVREAMLTIARRDAMSKTNLIRATAKMAHNCGVPAAKAALTSLVKSGEVRSAKTVGATGLYYATDTPQALVSASLALLMERLRRLNIDAGEISTGTGAPAQATPLTESTFEAIRRLQPSPGVPVSVQQLRSAMVRASKQELDAAVLSLADAQKIYLTTHDHGWSLPEAEREQLVWDGGQKLYVAVTLRD